MAEPFILFFLLRQVSKDLKTLNPLNIWSKRIFYMLIAIAIFFVLDEVMHLQMVGDWIWHAAIFFFIAIPFINKQFASFKTAAYAVLPYAIISFAADIWKIINVRNYDTYKNYREALALGAIIWLVAMLYTSRKQQKALQKEHLKTIEQEAQKIQISIRKEELEKIVAERTFELRSQKEKVEQALAELKNTQSQLVQSEKMASLGELTAGIAHEIQNPLNFVNNFAEVNAELIEEMHSEINKGNMEEIKAIANDIKENEKKISFHGKRADAIVKGMLQHSRNSSGEKELTDINALADEYLRLGYHGLRAKDKSFNASLETHFDETIGKVNIVPQDIGRVILNLFTNAFYSVSEKQKLQVSGYEPKVCVATKNLGNEIEIKVKDNGMGIPQKVIDKIFQPFFTTKPTGAGTGLGLSLSYDIITKGHGGKIQIETEEGTFAEFAIFLPV